MGLEANVAGLVAALDLKLVRLLRSAMAPESAPVAGLGAAAPTDRFEPRPVHHPEPRIEPRPVIHPTPRFAPRPVHHPEPRFEPAPCDCPGVIAVDPSQPKFKIEPPWKELPPVKPPPGPVRIKVQVPPPDIVSKGSLIDMFL